MPKTSHGPVPIEAPPSLVEILSALRDSYVFLRPEMAHRYEVAIERAEVLEGRLNDLHDAVEGAIQDLNEDAVLHELGRKTEEALARLNKVL